MTFSRQKTILGIFVLAIIFFRIGFLIVLKFNSLQKNFLKTEQEKRDAELHFKSAVKYMSGRIAIRDFEKAKVYLKKAALLKHEEACFHLGMLYDSDKITRKPEKAKKYLISIAEDGHVSSQSALGNIYFEEHNFKQAKYWLKKASHKRDTLSLCTLSNMYTHGMGVKQNISKAKYYLTIAEKQPIIYRFQEPLIKKIKNEMRKYENI